MSASSGFYHVHCDLYSAVVNKLIKEMVPNIRVSTDARDLLLNCCSGEWSSLLLPPVHPHPPSLQSSSTCWRQKLARCQRGNRRRSSLQVSTITTSSPHHFPTTHTVITTHTFVTTLLSLRRGSCRPCAGGSLNSGVS